MKRSHTSLNEQGIVSMIVVFMLMIVITIITLSFASVVRREQRQSLDRQLQQQAYYAAESGINIAQNAIQKFPLLASTTPKTDCKPGIANSIYGSLNGVVDGDGESSYSCLMIDPTPPSLQYDLSPSSGSRALPLTPSDGSQLANVVVSWTPGANVTNPLAGCQSAGSVTFKESATDWQCGYGVIRLDLAQVPLVGNITRTGLQQNAFTATIVPTSGGGSGSTSYNDTSLNPSGGLARQAIIGNATCSTTACSFTVTNLPVGKYYARISSIYNNSKVTVNGSSAFGAVRFKDAQIVIDSTGRAQDVYKRIQVRKSSPQNTLNNVYEGNADFGIQTKDSICKRFQVFPGYTNNTDDTGPGCR